MKKIKYLIIVLSISLSFFGCDKRLEQQNPNLQTSVQYWKTAADASAGVVAIYNSMIQDGSYQRMFPALTDGRGDDFKGDSPWGDLVQVANFTIPTTSGPVQWVWAQHYQWVYRTNQVLTYVPDITMDEALKKRLLGQAYFLRALAYFNLARTYKQVPLIISLPKDQAEYYPPTATEDELWNQIFADFQKAAEMLPVNYNSVSGADQGQVGRATKGAAVGLLGKAYLYRQKWQEAANQFKLIIDGPELNVYSLVPDFRDNFKPTNENNTESLFEIQFADPSTVGGTVGNYGGEPNANWKQVNSIGHTYAMEGFGYSDFLPTRWIYDEFKKEKTVDGNLDPRLLATIASYEPGVSELAYFGPWNNPKTNIYPRKYTHDGIPGFVNENNGIENSGINYRVLRFSDVLLMYAEALNELGQTASAYPYIQRVRNRAKLPDLATTKPGMSQADMREQLAHERALEFAIEAQRINDIIRWGWLYNAGKLAELKTHDSDFNTWAPGNEYLPIPQTELDVNKNLKPNPAN
ncbi:RagB/SusD family nutrient uptake outer membrane protein [Mucilaginibacter sp. ZT4R22]|uniref:RagB/SusD family nutrient uptake outer membrane protein n=1 Tax=Mucilaginibacter pankratovii TaxID=2772110 RepID=A0ABR7WS07_9SPHI|nr:RagB/SusD family nutrient uptake outer membrane protein [Mucilaginibacter pankratovii]MBD1365086.1 RagB/SusD family nutrient uptake outer membrane protein [Mucilaginibacter pankratovii]